MVLSYLFTGKLRRYAVIYVLSVKVWIAYTVLSYLCESFVANRAAISATLHPHALSWNLSFYIIRLYFSSCVATSKSKECDWERAWAKGAAGYATTQTHSVVSKKTSITTCVYKRAQVLDQ